MQARRLPDVCISSIVRLTVTQSAALCLANCSSDPGVCRPNIFLPPDALAFGSFPYTHRQVQSLLLEALPSFSFTLTSCLTLPSVRGSIVDLVANCCSTGIVIIPVFVSDLCVVGTD